MQQSVTKTAVLGAGSWGTALAILLARNGFPTCLWGNETDQIRAMAKKRCNSYYLPDIAFPEALTVTTDLSDAVSNCQDILIVVPSHAFAELVHKLPDCLDSQARIAWATKGLDQQTGGFLHRVVEKVFNKDRALAILSGPSFALEVAKELPTAVALASNSPVFAQQLSAKLNNHYFRVYFNDDLLGVQLCGAVKNVLAIAAGVADGLGFGSNARAALITRGLAEMTRLGVAMGANPATFMGLAGVGDLVLTCTDNQSRNRRFGIALTQCVDRVQAEKTIGQVVEGIYNTQQVFDLAKQYQVDMPITQQMLAILKEECTPKQAAEILLTRKTTSEVL